MAKNYRLVQVRKALTLTYGGLEGLCQQCSFDKNAYKEYDRYVRNKVRKLYAE